MHTDRPRIKDGMFYRQMDSQRGDYDTVHSWKWGTGMKFRPDRRSHGPPRKRDVVQGAQDSIPLHTTHLLNLTRSHAKTAIRVMCIYILLLTRRLASPLPKLLSDATIHKPFVTQTRQGKKMEPADLEPMRYHGNPDPDLVYPFWRIIWCWAWAPFGSCWKNNHWIRTEIQCNMQDPIKLHLKRFNRLRCSNRRYGDFSTTVHSIRNFSCTNFTEGPNSG